VCLMAFFLAHAGGEDGNLFGWLVVSYCLGSFRRIDVLSFQPRQQLLQLGG